MTYPGDLRCTPTVLESDFWKMTLASGDLDSTVTSELLRIPHLIGHQDLLYAGTPEHFIDNEHLAENGI